jgi:hypothetical protein
MMSPLDDRTRILLGLDTDARIAVAASQLTESSLEELRGTRAERYLALFQRFCAKTVLGLGASVTLDLLRDATGFSARILVARSYPDGELDSLQPDLQLESLRLNIARWATLKPVDPVAHLESVAKLQFACALDPAIASVEFGEFKASAVLPVELAPSGTGLVAELIDSSVVDHTLVRFTIAPAVGSSPDQSLLASQLSAIEAIRTNRNAPSAVTFRANAIRKGLHRMMNSWLGQPCTVEVQVRSVTPERAEPVVRVLCSELSRPKDDELHEALGRHVTFWSDSGSESADLLGKPSASALPKDSVSSLPIPSFWVSGAGDRPKHLASMRTAFLLVVPPSPQYCDLSSVGSNLVEDRTAKRPELWLGASAVCKDSAGNDICLDKEALSRHVHVIGVPGSGKTTLLHGMINCDINNANGIVVLDPHGDLAARVTNDRAWRDVGGNSIDESGLGHVGEFTGLKILCSIDEGERAVERDVGTLIEALEAPLPKLYSGPRFRQLVRTCLTLHAYVGQSQPVANAFDVLLEEEFAERALDNFTGPQWIRRELGTYWLPHPQSDRAELADWVVSKITDYLRTEIAGRMFAPTGCGMTGLELVEDGTRLVVDFASSGISMHDGGMLGQLFLTVLLRSVMTGGPQRDRRFMIYLDEVHLFFGPSVDRLLQEGRKYGLSIVAAHQSASQLSKERFDALMAQVGLEMVFRASLADSNLLAERLSISSQSIANLDDFRAWIAGSIAMKRGGPFLADIERPW